MKNIIMNTDIKLSIVSTLYKSEDSIEEFINRINKYANKLVKDNYELILVNDGSPDRSLEIAKNLLSIYKNLKIINLSRNFGHHRSLLVGLEYSVGDYVFLIDSDLEESPHELLNFADKMRQSKADVIYGVQSKRKDKIFTRLTAFLFFKIFYYLTNLKYPENITTLRLMNRDYVNALLRFKEAEPYLIGIWELTGFTQIPLKVRKEKSSKSTYTFRKRLALAINSIVSFSDRPLRGIFYFGFIQLIFVLMYSFYVTFNFILYGNSATGWTSLIISIWFLGSVVITILGILGIYLSKIFIETKKRPRYIVKDIINDNIDKNLKKYL